MKARYIPLVAVVLLAVVGCGSSSTGASSTNPAHAWSHGYPNSIAVLGDSGATGENSDPDQPGVEVRANSWATGTNPQVESLYLRILRHNPAIKDHNTNYAEAGGDVVALAGQADRLLATDHEPALIVIQIMDNDLTCPLDHRALSSFRSELTATLQKLARGAPDSREFVVSQGGSPATYADALTRAERASQGGTGSCDFMTPTGAISAPKVARAEHSIHAYEAALKIACATVRQCTYDGGAFGRIVDQRENYSSDLNHLSIAGHAHQAAVAWATMQRLHLLPRIS